MKNDDLRITLRATKKYIRVRGDQSQILPVALTINTKNMLGENQNLGIDLVIVIDTSASMTGQKISLVKETLIFIINLMKSNDRLSLVTFDDQGTRLTPLIRVYF